MSMYPLRNIGVISMFINKSSKNPNQIHTFQLTDFNGGINNVWKNPKDNQTPDMMNLSYGKDNMLISRPGITCSIGVPNNLKPLSEDVMWVDVKPTENSSDGFEVFRHTSSKLYLDDAVLHTLADSKHRSGVWFHNAYWFCDDGGLYAYFDASKFEESTHLKFPEGTPTSGRLVYKIVNPPDTITPIDKDANDKPYTTGVVKINKTKQTMWYEPCKLQMESEFFGIGVIPEKGYVITADENNLFLAGTGKTDDTIYIGDIDVPFYFPSFHSVQTEAGSDRVTALIHYDNSIIIAKQYSMYRLDGSTAMSNASNPYELHQINVHTGMPTQHCYSLLGSDLCYLGSDGNMYALSNPRMSDKYLVTTQINPMTNFASTPYNFTINDEFLNSAWVSADTEKLYLINKEKIAVYDMRFNAWLYHSYEEDMDCAIMYPNRVNCLVNKNAIYRISEDLPYDEYKNGSETTKKQIRSYWKSKWFDMGNAYYDKYFRTFSVLTDMNNMDINVGYTFSYNVDYFKLKKYIQPFDGESTWGKTIFGDRFKSKLLEQFSRYDLYLRGKQIQFSITPGYIADKELATYDELATELPGKDKIVYCLDVGLYYGYNIENHEWVQLTSPDDFYSYRITNISGEYEIITKAWLR